MTTKMLSKLQTYIMTLRHINFLLLAGLLKINSYAYLGALFIL